MTWQDLSFLRQHTSLPILLKGIMHPDDARKAISTGCGWHNCLQSRRTTGRRAQGAAISALPDVVAAVEGQLPVLFDSGIRRASDILKALALGEGCAVGTSLSLGSGLAGEEGGREVLGTTCWPISI